jgi:hypothetical protein
MNKKWYEVIYYLERQNIQRFATCCRIHWFTKPLTSFLNEFIPQRIVRGQPFRYRIITEYPQTKKLNRTKFYSSSVYTNKRKLLEGNWYRICKTVGSHGEYEDCCLMGYCNVESGRWRGTVMIARQRLERKRLWPILRHYLGINLYREEPQQI